MIIELIDRLLIPILDESFREEALGDLWEAHLKLKAQRKAPLIRNFLLIWRTVLLIKASVHIWVQKIYPDYEAKWLKVQILKTVLSSALSLRDLNQIKYLSLKRGNKSRDSGLPHLMDVAIPKRVDPISLKGVKESRDLGSPRLIESRYVVETAQDPFIRTTFRLTRSVFLCLGILFPFLLSGLFGFLDIAWMVIQLIGPWLLLSAVLVCCFLAVAIIFETTRRV